jgi:hypothetical protein
MSRFGFVVGLVSVFGLTACEANGPTESEELSGSDERTEEAAQEIGGDGASTYYVVTRPDYRKCAYPMCGGVFVKRVNQAKTKCAGGGNASECHAVDVDLSAVGLDDVSAADFAGAFHQSQGLVRGELKVVVNEYGLSVKTLVVSEAWRAAGEAAPTGTFYGVTGNGVKCFTWPCPSLTEEKLNTSTVRSIHDLDLSATGADDAETSAAYGALYDGGILVAGTHQSVAGPGGTGTRLLGNALYLRVEPGAPAGQACGDTVCGEGLECCNASCGWCVPPGQYCIQIACDPAE